MHCSALAASLVAVLLASLPACTITFREKPLLPVENDRNFSVGFQEGCWNTTQTVVEGFGPEIKEVRLEEENRAGLIVTDFAVLPDTGPDVKHLKKVAHTGNAGFIGGRYALTVTVREIRGERCKVKVVSRIEGYLGQEYGYQVLRSTGLLEEEILTRIGQELSSPAVAEG